MTETPPDTAPSIAPEGKSDDEIRKDWLRVANEAFEGSTSYFDSSIRAQVEQDYRAFNSQHPNGSKYLTPAFQAKSKHFRPKTRAAIRHHEASAAEAFFAHDDVISVDAENDDDKTQQATAEVHKYLLDYRLKKTIPWFLTVLGAYQDAQTVGVVVSHQHWRYDPKKRVDTSFVDLIPIENVRFHPAADWRDPVNSSPYWIHLIPMYVKDVRAMAQRGLWVELDDNTILQAVKGTTDSVRMAREGNQRTDPSDAAQTSITDFTVVWVHRIIVDMGDGDVVYHTLGKVQLLDDPMPLDEFVHHGRRPYTMGFCILEAHKVYPGGVSRLAFQPQQEVNQIVNARTDNWLYALNRRYFVKRNGGMVDTRSLQRNSPGGVTLMNDPEKDVKVLDTQDVTRSAFQEQDRANADMDDLLGAMSTSSVDTNRRLGETVGGMNILTTSANQVGTYQLLTFILTWMQPVLRQLHLLEVYYETDDTVIALAGDAAKLSEKLGEDVTIDDLLDREMTVNVNVGMGAATNPHMKVDNLIQGLKAMHEVIGDGALDKYGIDIREITTVIFSGLGFRSGKRFFRWGAEDPTLLAAQNTIKQLQDALDKKLPPELLAAQVAKLGAETRTVDAKTVETVVRAMFAALQSGELVAAIPQVAPIADALLAAGARGAEGVAGAPVPMLPGQGPIGIQAVKDKRTGLAFTPNPGDTSPQTPALPASPTAGPEVGVNQGINTVQADSA